MLHSTALHRLMGVEEKKVHFTYAGAPNGHTRVITTLRSLKHLKTKIARSIRQHKRIDQKSIIDITFTTCCTVSPYTYSWESRKKAKEKTKYTIGLEYTISHARKYTHLMCMEICTHDIYKYQKARNKMCMIFQFYNTMVSSISPKPVQIDVVATSMPQEHSKPVYCEWQDVESTGNISL